jgi:hypothetical protein
MGGYFSILLEEAEIGITLRQAWDHYAYFAER